MFSTYRSCRFSGSWAVVKESQSLSTRNDRTRKLGSRPLQRRRRSARRAQRSLSGTKTRPRKKRKLESFEPRRSRFFGTRYYWRTVDLSPDSRTWSTFVLTRFDFTNPRFVLYCSYNSPSNTHLTVEVRPLERMSNRYDLVSRWTTDVYFQAGARTVSSNNRSFWMFVGLSGHTSDLP